MVTLYRPSATAQKMWALPGAMFTGMRRPDVVNGFPVAGPDSARVDMPCPSFLIQHERGLVLFDTGVSPKGLRDPEAHFPHLVRQFGFDCLPELGVDAQIQGLGFRLDDVKYVVPSHLHFDHAGGLYLFPNATFIVGADELGFAYHPDDGFRPYFLLDDLVPTRDFRWIETGADMDLFGDGSVIILRTPGHTPGSIAMFVRLPQRNLVLTGDVCHYRTEVDAGIPLHLKDDVAGIASLRRLILIRDAWDATIWIGHDIDDWNAMPHAPEHIE